MRVLCNDASGSNAAIRLGMRREQPVLESSRKKNSCRTARCHVSHLPLHASSVLDLCSTSFSLPRSQKRPSNHSQFQLAPDSQSLNAYLTNRKAFRDLHNLNCSI